MWNEGEKKRRRNDHLNCVCLVSGWEESALRITNETSRHGQQQCDIGTILLSTMYLLLSHLSLFCSLPPLCNLFSSLLFSSGTVPCPVLFSTSSDLFSSLVLRRLILLFTVLLYCPQLNKGTCHRTDNSFSVYGCARGAFSAEDPLGIGTQS